MPHCARRPESSSALKSVAADHPLVPAKAGTQRIFSISAGFPLARE
jgi:hypothetical protein